MGIYYQFAYDVGNQTVYDAKGYDNKWSCDWNRSIQRYPNRWKSIATIALEVIGCNVTALKIPGYRPGFNEELDVNCRFR